MCISQKDIICNYLDQNKKQKHFDISEAFLIQHYHRLITQGVGRRGVIMNELMSHKALHCLLLVYSDAYQLRNAAFCPFLIGRWSDHYFN
jgi:hypothetical protein